MTTITELKWLVSPNPPGYFKLLSTLCILASGLSSLALLTCSVKFLKADEIVGFNSPLDIASSFIIWKLNIPSLLIGFNTSFITLIISELEPKFSKFDSINSVIFLILSTDRFVVDLLVNNLTLLRKSWANSFSEDHPFESLLSLEAAFQKFLPNVLAPKTVVNITLAFSDVLSSAAILPLKL